MTHENTAQKNPSPENTLGALDQIAKALENAGVDAPSSLFDEALSLARQGLLGAARDRLRMLLCLDPDDGDAHLLLAKVFIAQQNWSEALAQLDAARAARVHVPPNLQTEVETALANERNSKEVHSQRQSSREQAELRALRMETRNLRAENTRMDTERRTLTSRVRVWSIATAAVATLSLGLCAALYMSPGSSSAAAAPVEVSTSSEPLPTSTGNASSTTTELATSPISGAPPSAGSVTSSTSAAVIPTAIDPSKMVAMAESIDIKTDIKLPASPESIKESTETRTVRAAPTKEPIKAAPPKSDKKSSKKDDKKSSKKDDKKSTTGKSTGKAYSVKSGDTLSGLAVKFYRDSAKWTVIRDANKGKLGPRNTLTPGTRLVIP